VRGVSSTQLRQRVWIIIALELVPLAVVVYFWSTNAADRFAIDIRWLQIAAAYWLPITVAIPCAVGLVFSRERRPLLYGVLVGGVVGFISYVADWSPLVLISPLAGLYRITVGTIVELIRPSNNTLSYHFWNITVLSWLLLHGAYGGIIANLLAHKRVTQAVLLLAGTWTFNLLLLGGLFGA
jgi:hypothetical protein